MATSTTSLLSHVASYISALRCSDALLTNIAKDAKSVGSDTTSNPGSKNGNRAAETLDRLRKQVNKLVVEAYTLRILRHQVHLRVIRGALSTIEPPPGLGVAGFNRRNMEKVLSHLSSAENSVRKIIICFCVTSNIKFLELERVETDFSTIETSAKDFDTTEMLRRRFLALRESIQKSPFLTTKSETANTFRNIWFGMELRNALKVYETWNKTTQDLVDTRVSDLHKIHSWIRGHSTRKGQDEITLFSKANDDLVSMMLLWMISEEHPDKVGVAPSDAIKKGGRAPRRTVRMLLTGSEPKANEEGPTESTMTAGSGAQTKPVRDAPRARTPAPVSAASGPQERQSGTATHAPTKETQGLSEEEAKKERKRAKRRSQQQRKRSEKRREIKSTRAVAEAETTNGGTADSQGASEDEDSREDLRLEEVEENPRGNAIPTARPQIATDDSVGQDADGPRQLDIGEPTVHQATSPKGTPKVAPVADRQQPESPRALSPSPATSIAQVRSFDGEQSKRDRGVEVVAVRAVSPKSMVSEIVDEVSPMTVTDIRDGSCSPTPADKGQVSPNANRKVESVELDPLSTSIEEFDLADKSLGISEDLGSTGHCFCCSYPCC